MQNCRFLSGYGIFVNIATTCDLSVFPEYDSSLRLRQNVL